MCQGVHNREMTQMAQMGHKDAGTRPTEPELDEALARAIRLLISDAIEAGPGPAPDAGASAA
jgi:hypothetical protein